MNVIVCEQITKYYNQNLAVDNLNLQVKKGEFFAFLGPNGAGKSTTISMYCTLLKPTSGSIQINGFELGKEDDAIRKSIGVVFQYSVLDDLLTIKENMRIRSGFYHLSKSEFEAKYKELDELIGLSEIADKKYGECSGGQRRRADIARALLHSPDILFLDEPTTGLDPQTRKRVWEVIMRIRKIHKTTIFLTTHYMEEAQWADRVAIIDEGRIKVCDTPSQLKRKYTRSVVRILPKILKETIDLLENISVKYKVRSDSISVYTSTPLDSLFVLNYCKEQLESFEVVEGNMDDVFIAITGKTIREDIG